MADDVETGCRSGLLGRSVAAGAIALLLLIAAGCTSVDSPVGPVPTESASSLGVPEVPVPTEPARAVAGDGSVMADDDIPAMVMDLAPSPGDTVVLHLAGPLSNLEATDVVIRNEDGAEVERFRLPGAVGVWAAPGSPYAMVYTLADGWARYDAAAETLSMVPFPGDDPGPTIRAGSGLAGPAAIWDPLDTRWLLRMDTGTVSDLQASTGEGRLDQLAANGEFALIATQDGPVLLTTATAEVRPLGGASAAAISQNGLIVASLRPGGDGPEVTVEAPDGSERQVLAATPGTTGVQPLNDGRVVLLGPVPAVVQADTELQPLEPAVSIGRPLRVSAGDRRALVSTGVGLAVIDLVGLTIQPIPDTIGFVPYDLGPATILWAISTDPQQPGGLLVDPATGEVTRFLNDRPTERILSVSQDGRRISLALGGDGPPTVLVDADGSVTPVDTLDGRAEAILHPDGDIAVVSQVGRTDQSLLVGALGSPMVEVPTGRNPVWLSTSATGGQPNPGFPPGVPLPRPAPESSEN